MIDGVKIKCIGTTPEVWLNNTLLKFCTKVDTTTGEVLAKNRVAYYRGLAFHIVPSRVSADVHLFAQGSLATYYNGGVNNAFDFDVNMLAETIAELQTKLNINPDTAVIQSFEFGANIVPDQSVQSIIKGLRAYQSDTFGALKMDKVFNGKQLKRYETNLKLYDKGLQIAKPQLNTIRIEYCFLYSRIVNKHGFSVLADFLDVDKLNALKSILLDVWANIIYYDKGMSWRLMNQKQKEKMLYYLDATNWGQFTKMQRKRAKENFRELYDQFCTSTTQADVLGLLAKKLNDLTAKKCYHFKKFSNEFEAEKMLLFQNKDKDRNSNKKLYENIKQKKVGKCVKIQLKKCCVCGSDISHKKRSALYCSKHCNNSNQATKRKMKRHEQNKVENKNLTKLLDNLDKGNLLLLVEYKTDSGTYADHLEQNEISTTTEWVRCVYRVTIQQKTTPIVLNSYRARRLIQSINKLNKYSKNGEI